MAQLKADQIADLLSSVGILNDSVKAIVNEWKLEGEGQSVGDTGMALPSISLYSAQKTVLAALGKISELISGPQMRLMELSGQYFESRALHICAEHRIADLLDGHDEHGLSVEELGRKTKLDPLKLSRIIRCLTSSQIFREVEPEKFANNRISAALVRNESLRAYIMVFGTCHFTMAGALPRALTDSVTGPSNQVDETAFNLAHNTKLPFFEWMEQKIPSDNGGEEIPRPELALFSLGMVGVGKVTSTAHIYDFPWDLLGNKTVVDVGGGVGGFALQLANRYPDLKLIVQDRADVISNGYPLWNKENPKAISENRVKLMAHDFFTIQPVKSAAVYWLRYILHDWPDEACIKILSSIVPSMTKDSRIVLAELVLNTTLGCKELSPAPKPLPANYGLYPRYSHQRDLVMMSLFNSVERTPDHFRRIIEKSGLVIEKIWECRSQTSLIECRLPTVL